MRRRRVQGLLVGMVSIAALASAAPALGSTSATLLSDADAYIGDGRPRVYYDDNALFNVTGTPEEVSIFARNRRTERYHDFSFRAPPGEILKTQTYRITDGQGEAGMSVSGSGRGCNSNNGYFTIKQLKFDGEGGVSRAWIVFEQNCERQFAPGSGEATWGEVIVNIPDEQDDITLAPRRLRWPDITLGDAGQAVPATVVNHGAEAVRLRAATVRGRDEAAFPVRLDECASKTLQPGRECRVWLRFAPEDGGESRAALVIPKTNGDALRVPLSGKAWGGRTRLKIESSSRDDWIGQGHDYVFRPSDTDFSVGGDRQEVWFQAETANGDDWYGEFAAPDGDILAPGTYRHARRAAFRGTAPGLDISTTGRGCNEIAGRFEILEMKFNHFDQLTSFAVDFTQRCDGGPPLTGSFYWHAFAD